MNITVSPVTEPEVRSFFSRLSTMIVNASDQDQQIKRVQADMDNLQHRVDDLVNQNSTLKTEVAETWQLVQNVEKERDEAKIESTRAKNDLLDANNRHVQDVRDYEDRLAAAHDAMAGRDSRIAELEQSLATAQRECGNWQSAANSHERNSVEAIRQVDWWRDRFTQTEKRLTEAEVTNASMAKAKVDAETKLASIQALFAPPLPEMKQLEAPKPAPSDAGGFGYGPSDEPAKEAAGFKPW